MPLSAPVHRNYNVGRPGNAAAMIADRHRPKKQYGKRKAQISTKRNDAIGSFPMRDSGSFGSSIRIGSLAEAKVCLRPTASLRTHVDRGPVTPTKRDGSFSWSPEKQSNEIPSKSSFIDNYKPKRFQRYSDDDMNFDSEDEENAPPNTDRFYDARCDQVSPSSSRSNLDNVQTTPYAREVSRSVFQPDCNIVSSDADSICMTKSGITGLYNLGNTCFMNAAIQCLAHTPSLADFFLSKDYRLFLSTKNQKLVNCFADVIEKIYQSNDAHNYYSHVVNSPCSPDDFLEEFTEDTVAPQFGGSRQHDSHEFLRVLLDQLCECLKDTEQCRENYTPLLPELELDNMPLPQKANYWWSRHLHQNASRITDLFCGQLISTTSCEVCKTKAFCFDPFYDISLPFPEASQSARNNLQRRSSMFSMSTGGDLSRCTLDDCLLEFTKNEVLGEENMIYCSNCQEKRVSMKSLQVYRFPPVLVLHLKRFGNSRKKVRTSVEFPHTSLDVSPLAYEGLHSKGSIPTYDLYGIIDHSGRLNFGHYTASCLDPHSNSWYDFNDEKVSSMDESYLDEAGAYMLFYKMQT